jgi:hypothetical protein
MHVAVEEIIQKAVHAIEADGLVRCHSPAPANREDQETRHLPDRAKPLLRRGTIRTWAGPS